MDANDTNISRQGYNRILETVFSSLKKRGFKATTMDSIASQLSMSKRTLYEIFENKDQMFAETIKYSRRQHRAVTTRIFTQSATVIEAIIKSLRFHLEQIEQINPLFFQDMDNYAKKMREVYDAENTHDLQSIFMNIIKLGIQQDVFRDDVDYRITIRFLHIQIESLKRTEEFFPKDVSLTEIFSTLGINFLRSIATPKGMAIIDDYLKQDKEKLIQ